MECLVLVPSNLAGRRCRISGRWEPYSKQNTNTRWKSLHVQPGNFEDVSCHSVKWGLKIMNWCSWNNHQITANLTLRLESWGRLGENVNWTQLVQILVTPSAVAGGTIHLWRDTQKDASASLFGVATLSANYARQS